MIGECEMSKKYVNARGLTTCKKVIHRLVTVLSSRYAPYDWIIV